MQMDAFFEEEGFEGRVKSGWISLDNREGESIPDLWANNICRPAIQCRLSGRNLTKEPLVADLSPSSRNLCSASERQV